MAFDSDKLKLIYARTSGRCHLCSKKVAFSNYGILGARGAWEVDHSVPRARGGTDRLNNVLPACIPCNRSKGDGSTRSARAKNGRTRKPMSEGERGRARGKQAAGGAVVGGAIGFFLGGPPGAVAGAAIGAGIGASVDPEG